MKNSIYFLIVLLIVACNNSTINDAEKPASTLSAGQFNPNAGSIISSEEAKKMINAFGAKYPEMMKSYYFGNDVYRSLLEMPESVGIRIYNGLDENARQVMILFAAGKEGNASPGTLMFEAGLPCPPLCEGNEFNSEAGKMISENLASRRRGAFTATFPNMIRGYYFGKEAYKSLLELPESVGIRIHQGIDDNGKQVMILTPVGRDGETLYSTLIYEFGAPCPPYCHGS